MNCSLFIFFNDTATTEIYTLSLHDALPILGFVRRVDSRDDHRVQVADLLAGLGRRWAAARLVSRLDSAGPGRTRPSDQTRSEEHTSELQSRQYLVCRLLLEKKNKSYFLFTL